MRINVDTGIDINTNKNITASYNTLNLNIFFKVFKKYVLIESSEEVLGQEI